MSLILPSASEATMLKFALGVITPGNQRLKLFVNNYAPRRHDRRGQPHGDEHQRLRR
jgi:hypothetical protein